MVKGGCHYVNMQTSTEQLLTIEQLADVLQIPKQTLYRWRSEGSGPRGMRVGRHVRYRRTDVEAWLDERVAVPG